MRVEAVNDPRHTLRSIHTVAAVCQVLNGLSLLLQFQFPTSGVGKRGNEQLFYRGVLRLAFIPLHFVRGVVKLGSLDGTAYEVSPVEAGVHFLRAYLFIPFSAWSGLAGY